MSQYRICAVMPCWGRPARTRRMINNILAQNINNWEAFVIGDGCPVFNTLFDSGEAKFYQDLAASKGNKLHIFNLEKNYGGFGYHIINHCFEHNNSEYVIILGNDDIIAADHFQHYLSEIENTDLDIVAYKTFMKFLPERHCIRPVCFQGGLIGHAEIIIKSSTARQFKLNPEYGHDWELISKIHGRGKSKVATSSHFTYFVTHTAVTSDDPNIPFTFEKID